MHQTTRRQFIALSAGLAAAGIAAGGQPAASVLGDRALRPRDGGRRARNVILFVVDGMDHSTVMLADAVMRRRDGRPSAFVTSRAEPTTAWAQCLTHSASSLVTDSAAAGSAFGIGLHIPNGSINFTEAGEPTPILVRARDAGMATGLVTTTRITHATPAAMACNAPSRNLEDAIAEQLLDRRVDLLLGGGDRHFPAALIARHPDLAVIRDARELDVDAAPSTGRLLGLFNRSHLRFDLDRPTDEPSIEAMTAFALDRMARLGDAKNGFLMQIEAGRVDHAGHANDAAALVGDQIAFDKALDRCLEFVERRDDTLLIVTTDHGCGGAHLTLYERQAADGLDRLGRAKWSYEWLDDQFPEGRWSSANPARLREALAEMTAGDVPAERVDWLLRALDDPAIQPDGFDVAARGTSLLGAMLANLYATAFVSPNHNADYVEVLARGPGSERLTRLIDNVDIHRLMIEELGLPPAS